MATTNIHSIATTPQLALNYCLADKIEIINSENDINADIPHEIFEEFGQKYVRYFTLTSYQNCNVNNPYSSFEALQRKWQNVKYQNNGTRSKNNKEPLMYHLVQSFNGHEVSYETANEIGRKLAEEVFAGFTVCISTHGNTDSIHNHFNISAWDENGKKWNDCHRTKRLIREVSDRLCEEYGLSVLEKTRDMNLIKYKDASGKTRYYEPTDRKNELLRQRQSGEITTDDVASYRNTEAYSKKQKVKLNHQDEIKRDIDSILPSCRSYDELLKRLRDLGYTVRDKKQNGEWMQHISFRAPTHEKATREDKIGDGEFYTRQNLERYFAERAKLFSNEEFTHREYDPSIPYFENYEYGKIDIGKINVKRKTIFRDGKYYTEDRSEAEQKVILDIRVKDSEVQGLIDKTPLEEVIRKQNLPRNRRTTFDTVRTFLLIDQIKNSFRCLQYAEKNNIYSYEQILQLYTASKSKYEAVVENFNIAEKSIDRFKDVLMLPRVSSELRKKIESKKQDMEYLVEEYNDDLKLLKQYESAMKKFKIDTADGIQQLETKVAEFVSKQENNRRHIEKLVYQMSELENCIRTFDRIDTENGKRKNAIMEQFEKMHHKHSKTDRYEQGTTFDE